MVLKFGLFVLLTVGVIVTKKFTPVNPVCEFLIFQSSSANSDIASFSLTNMLYISQVLPVHYCANYNFAGTTLQEVLD